MNNDNFSGIIFKRTNGKSVTNGYGYRDKANKIDNNVATKFGTASLGKVFVAVGIMKLIEQENFL